MIADVEGLPDAAFLTDEEDLSDLRATLTAFIHDRVDAADASGVVVCMSGGIDSTVTATLCVEALGADRVTALVLPCNITDARDARDAEKIARNLNLAPVTIQMRPLVRAFESDVAPSLDGKADRHAAGNVIARLRMVIAYYVANRIGGLVCGTSNRTELLLGYFTKYGDGAADLRPIVGLYKTEVQALAGHLNVASAIIEKAPTAGFWAGQTDETDLGAPYGLLDLILHNLIDNDLGIEGTADSLGLDPNFIGQYAHEFLQHAHKRTRVPTPGVRQPPGDLFVELESRGSE